MTKLRRLRTVNNRARHAELHRARNAANTVPDASSRVEAHDPDADPQAVPAAASDPA